MIIRRVTVLGGSGFIGRHIVHELVAQGLAVRVPSAHPDKHKDLRILPGVDLVEADVHDDAQLRAVLEDADAVINLVGILNEDRHQRFEQVHVQLPKRVVGLCRELGIRRLLHMSALRASPTAPSRYLRSKADGEAAVMAAEGPELHVTSFRPSVVFGYDDHFITHFYRLLRIAPGWLPLPGARARFAPVFVEDVALAFARALRHVPSYGKVYELCGPKAYFLWEIVSRISEQSGERKWVIRLGETASALMAALLQWLPGKPLTPDNLASMKVDSVCGLDGLPQGLKALGIRPTPMESVLPYLFGQLGVKHRYDRLRRFAHREEDEWQGLYP